MTAKRNDGATRRELLHEIGLVWDLRSSKKRQPQKQQKDLLTNTSKKALLGSTEEVRKEMSSISAAIPE
jgi:hypothetical protein